LAKVTFEFDDTDPDDRDTIRKIVHLDDMHAKMYDAYYLVRNRNKYVENIDDEQSEFLDELLQLLWVEVD